MKSTEETELARDLVTSGYWRGFYCSILCGTTDVRVQKPGGIQLWDTDESPDKIIQKDIDIEAACNPIISAAIEREYNLPVWKRSLSNFAAELALWVGAWNLPPSLMSASCCTM
jgi:hypothetical protein